MENQIVLGDYEVIDTLVSKNNVVITFKVKENTSLGSAIGGIIADQEISVDYNCHFYDPINEYGWARYVLILNVRA